MVYNMVYGRYKEGWLFNMTNKGAVVLQDVFLNQIRKDRVPVTIHLTNGFQLKGLVKGFDNFVLILESDNKQMMIYKHAISTVTPARTVSVTFGNNNESVDKS